MKRLIYGFIKRWNQTSWEEKLGGVMATLLAIIIIIVIVKNIQSKVLMLLLLIGTFVLFPVGILYCTIFIFLGEILFEVIKTKIKSKKG